MWPESASRREGERERAILVYLYRTMISICYLKLRSENLQQVREKYQFKITDYEIRHSGE